MTAAAHSSKKMDSGHIVFDNWGVKPILFRIGEFDVPSYPFFVLLGLLAGAAVYLYEAKRRNSLSEHGLLIAFGSLAGGILGAKVLEWMINYKYVISHLSNLGVLLSGRTIIGGMLGGVIGANLAKRAIGIKEKRGNLFAPAVALGVAVGRIGCFLRGCCYGKPTALPWGVDFGDSIPRHPTMLYESVFMLIMFAYLEKIKDKPDIAPGQLFKLLMVSYFIFRFLIEFIRVEPVAFAGLSVFQIISIVVIIYLMRDNMTLLINSKIYGKQK